MADFKWPGRPMATAPKDRPFLAHEPSSSHYDFCICWWSEREQKWIKVNSHLGGEDWCEPVCWWELPEVTSAAN